VAISGKDRVDKVFEQAGEYNGFVLDQVNKLAVIGERINADVGDAVRCLQFEDLVTRSMVAAEDHLQRLNTLEEMVERRVDLTLEPDDHRLWCLKNELNMFTASQWIREAKVVSQESMAGGDIELF